MDGGLQYWQQTGQFQQEQEEMGRYAKDSGGGDFEQAPAGNHIARCIRLVDLGTQHGTYEGKATTRNQVLMSFELCNERMANGEPFTIGGFYTNSLNEKAKLRAHLEAWRGRAFTEEELNGFDLQNVLGKPCMVSIVSEKDRSKIAALASMPKGMEAPPCVNKPSVFWLEDFDQAMFDAMTDGLKKIISESDEYKALKNGKAKPATGGSVADMADDIPF